MSEIELILTKLKIVSEEKENGMYLCDKEHSKILLDYIQQKENIIKEVRENAEMKIKGYKEIINTLIYSSVESKRYEINELKCRIREQEELLEILDKAGDEK